MSLPTWWRGSVPFAFSVALVLLPLTDSLYAQTSAASSSYYWRSTPAGDSSELVTLFCHACENYVDSRQDVPLLSVLRDTLGDGNSRNDKVTDVWLLTYSRPGLGKQVLSAVPFFYWRIADDSVRATAHAIKPFMNVSEPEHSMVSQAVRDVLQWTLFDPLSTPVRATTRAYQNNKVDHERLHIEEAEAYLRAAPVNDDADGLTDSELHTVIARLELRKRMLGGLVSEHRAVELGEETALQQARVTARNWELLRQCADKTGLYFEPITLAGSQNQYAVLWFPLENDGAPRGSALAPIWKLLNLKDPYTEREKLLTREKYTRELNGRQTQVVPLGVYSLSYPRMPLLLVDFRDGRRLRRKELTQRAINEITSGVIGVSRITNWYYFVGADVYNFYVSRHGGATNRLDRLAAYSQFRVALALDRDLDAGLRTTMQRRVDSLAVNPLDNSPQNEMRAAMERYELLAQVADSSKGFEKRLERQRRAELAPFEATPQMRVRDHVLHYATLGFYTHRSKVGADLLARLDRSRRAQYDLAFLDRISESGTDPEVANNSQHIKTAIAELSGLVPEIGRPELRTRAELTLRKLSTLSKNMELKAECVTALTAIKSVTTDTGGGVAALPADELEFASEPLK